ncbi:MAG: UvrD-helicase domain-containing protein [Rickettsiales bacterium]|jgi:ATP-dependent helicase/nuclease subunit A|nr:UvrD-helicase domain-containing protein [Rickettsiales bacterium]
MVGMNLLQRQLEAIDPLNSVWVEASAGSGKTTLLVNRLIRLLLSDIELSKIICITYTDSGAIEMKNRIKQKLASWLELNEEELKQELEKIGEKDVNKARVLFVKILDNSDDLKILTIHSFCKQILQQFALEANVVPYFQIIDDNKKQELFTKAKEQLMVSNDIKKELETILKFKNEDDFYEILERFIDERDKLLFLKGNGSVNDVYEKIRKILIDKDYNLEAEKNNNWEEYIKRFLTVGNEKKKNIKSKGEQDRVYNIVQYELNLKNYEYTKSFLGVAYKIFDLYENLKRSEGVLDFDDLLYKTKKLLSQDGGTDWVKYKLDSNLEHILLDEAQDTNPIQWEILKSITDDFFSGSGNHENRKIDRTLFVVGDKKQSIYSFQGANKEQFEINYEYYNKKFKEIGGELKQISLDYSFRSTKNILNFVDKVFEKKDIRDNITNSDLKHNGIREDEGRVEVHTLLLEDEEKEKEISWIKKDHAKIEKTKEQLLSVALATEIKNWFEVGKVIYDKEKRTYRKIEPKDIMILVKKRNNKLINNVTKQLRKNNIKVMGKDRFYIMEHIISKDIIALLKVILFPNDDLNVANIIKSPFLEMTDSELEKLCLERQDNLFDVLNNSFLKELQTIQKETSIYKFLKYLFRCRRDNFIARFGGITDEIFDEFLNLGSAYENNSNNATLFGFVDYIEKNEIILKRDMEQSINAIRIITAHSSKGAESPVVILLDIDHNSQTIHHNKNNIYYKNGFPIISLVESEKMENIKKKFKEEEYAEYLRLLYVAMTRARDELHICATCKQKKSDGKKKDNDKENKELNWYNLIKIVSEKWNTNENKNFTNVNYIGNSIDHKIDITPKEDESDNVLNFDFEFEQEERIKIVNPSHFYTNARANTIENNNNKETGILVHKMLENGIADTKNQKLNNLVVSIRNNYKYLFVEDNSIIKNEIAIYGKVDNFLIEKLKKQDIDNDLEVGNIISGQIDKLVIKNDEVLIVDFKWTKAKTVTPYYKIQLFLYKSMIEKIYKDKKVKCYILWLRTGEINEINFKN